MSHFTQTSATLINEKYYKGHSQAGKSKMKAMVMLTVGNSEGCVRVYAHVSVFGYVCI